MEGSGPPPEDFGAVGDVARGNSGGTSCGEKARGNDMVVNPFPRKSLTNMRSSNSDLALKLTTPKPMPLEAAIEWIEEDERVEVTPRSACGRQRVLDHPMQKGS